jgi:hypothetical protein
MDGSGPKFFSLIDSVLSIVLAASLLAARPRALAETGAIMSAIGQMKLDRQDLRKRWVSPLTKADSGRARRNDRYELPSDRGYRDLKILHKDWV